MSMNIKNDETVDLARQLAALTGESMTSAVTVAVRERLDRLTSDAAHRAERLLQIGRDVADRLDDTARSTDHGDVLYGEHGLPS